MNKLFGEIKLLPYTFTPIDYMECNGRGLSTTEYPILFSLLEYNFGGTGDTFHIPDIPSPYPHLKYYIATNGNYPAKY